MHITKMKDRREFGPMMTCRLFLFSGGESDLLTMEKHPITHNVKRPSDSTARRRKYSTVAQPLCMSNSVYPYQDPTITAR